MKITIYQINMERDINRIAFMAHGNLEQFQSSKDIDCKIYDKVFAGDIDCQSLEDIYRKFNLDHPEDYKGRSLSVSDVVEVKAGGKVTPGFYFCDSFGFEQIEFNPEVCPAFKEKTNGERISVIFIQPNKKPHLVEIGTSLNDMQAVVGGDIEEYMPFEDEVALICNEEGKVNGLPLNRAVYEEQTHEMIDIICGDFFIAYAPMESEKFLSMPKEMADKYADKFRYPERFFKVNDEIKAVPIKPLKDRER